MEAKKRAAATATSHDEPAAKKHAGETSVASRTDSQDGRLTRSRLKKFKKDAIYRTMKSCRREKELLELEATQTRRKLQTLEKVFALQESWWDNFADQISILVSTQSISPRPLASDNNFLLSIRPEDSKKNDEPYDQLETAYTEKNTKLKEKIALAFKLNTQTNAPNEEPTIKEHLSNTLHDLHQLKADNSAYKSQNDLLQNQLNELTRKYLSTEKKMERLKSPSLKTLFGTTPGDRETSEVLVRTEPAENLNGASTHENSDDNDSESKKISSEELDKLQSLLDESEAVVQKQKSYLDEQESRIEKLNDSIRSLSNRLANLSDNDVVQSVPYRSLKRRNEELLIQIDKLESYNSRYHREKVALINERTDFQQSVKAESEARVNEVQGRLNKTETDLVRIRAARDDLISSLNIKKATENERNKGMDELKELASIRESRIQALETEIKRLKDDPSLNALVDSSVVENANLDELKAMAQKLQRQNASLVAELPSLEAAFTQAHQKATAKVMDLLEREARTHKLVAEKTKADEKYFSAMRAKDALNNEYQKVRSQVAKSAEWVQQLKEVEKKHMLKISGLETRIEDMGTKQVAAEKERHGLHIKLTESERRLDSMRALVDKLNSDIKARERSVRVEIEGKRSIEVENEKLKKQVEIKNLTTVGRSSSSSVTSKNGGGNALDLEGQLEELRSIAICSVCTKNWKDTAIKVCGHVVCHDCAVSRLTSRLRKCPLCNRQFSQSDLLPVHL